MVLWCLPNRSPLHWIIEMFLTDLWWDSKGVETLIAIWKCVLNIIIINQSLSFISLFIFIAFLCLTCISSNLLTVFYIVVLDHDGIETKNSLFITERLKSTLLEYEGYHKVFAKQNGGYPKVFQSKALHMF